MPDTTPSAFPFVVKNNAGMMDYNYGMSKREYFALHLLQGIVTGYHRPTKAMVLDAIRAADLLVEALNES